MQGAVRLELANPFGDGLIALGHLAWAIYTLAAKPLLVRHDAMRVSLAAVLLSIPPLLLLALGEDFSLERALPALGWVIALAFLATALGSWSWNWALRRMSAGTMAVHLRSARVGSRPDTSRSASRRRLCRRRGRDLVGILGAARGGAERAAPPQSARSERPQPAQPAEQRVASQSAQAISRAGITSIGTESANASAARDRAISYRARARVEPSPDLCGVEQALRIANEPGGGESRRPGRPEASRTRRRRAADAHASSPASSQPTMEFRSRAAPA
jgi:hypothetical protein